MSTAPDNMTLGPGHPSEALLVDFTLGALNAAAALVVEAHLESCGACRHASDLLDEVGGALILSLPDLDMISEPADRAPDEGPGRSRGTASVGAAELPGCLAQARLAPRRVLPGGASITPILNSGSKPWRAFLLGLPAGGRLPLHGHSGAELVCVLEGAFTDGRSVYRAGDFLEAGKDCADHELAVVGDEPCVCLVALEGPIRWRGATRLIAPLVGI